MRSLGRSLRPLELEAEKLAQELEAELIAIDDGTELDGHLLAGATKPTPTQRKNYHEIEDLLGIADMAFSEFQSIRQDISRWLRPPRRGAVRKKARKV